jgi:hypothetical protein
MFFVFHATPLSAASIRAKLDALLETSFNIWSVDSMKLACSQAGPEVVSTGEVGEGIDDATLEEFVARRHAHIKEVLLVKLRR